jgi:Leucine-rich repeat (LRR) protein
MCDMPLLNKLDLSLNNLLGPIPSTISNCKKLGSLDLSQNNLLGSIPSTISNCKKLGSLDLSQNNLSGEDPLQIKYIPDLYLNLSHNHLTVHIPPQLVQTLSIVD